MLFVSRVTQVFVPSLLKAPDPPVSIMARAASSVSVRLEWRGAKASWLQPSDYVVQLRRATADAWDTVLDTRTNPRLGAAVRRPELSRSSSFVHRHTGLACDTLYRCRVRSVNSSGESAWVDGANFRTQQLPLVGRHGGWDHSFVWDQTAEDVEVKCLLPEGARKTDVDVSISTTRLRVETCGRTAGAARTLVEGTLRAPVRAELSTWHMESVAGRGVVLTVTLNKARPTPKCEGLWTWVCRESADAPPRAVSLRGRGGPRDVGAKPEFDWGVEERTWMDRLSEQLEDAA
jgi:hypothetical protein